MRKKTITLAALAVTAGSALGEEQEPDAFLGLTPTLDIRTRYEFREVDGLDASHSVTTRARVGLKTGEYAGFSAFGELEGTYALVDDFTTGGANTPNNPGATPINDPEVIELNRAWVQYKNEGFLARLGRQRIIRNGAAFIGNVGWRQNEQTFDAINLEYSGNGFTASYVYSNGAQRIFGADAGGPLEEFSGDFHFIDGSYSFDGGKVGGYAYIIDVDNSPAVGRSNTFGLFYEGNGLYLEGAWQDGTTTVGGVGDFDAFYGHAYYKKKIGSATYGIGLEYLEENFRTPFATVHKFNGFADAFIGQRLGLNNAGGAFEGISDIYVSYVRPGLPWDVTFKGFAHYYLDDGFSDAYGYEVDAVLVKKFGDNVTALLKAAFFFEDDGPGAFQDIQQVTLDLTYKF